MKDRKTITRKAIDQIVTPLDDSKETYLWDSKLEGFGVRCTTAGKDFVVRYGHDGNQHIEKVGSAFNSLSIERARQLATQRLVRASQVKKSGGKQKTQAGPGSLAEMRKRCREEVSVAAFYARGKELALDYGPLFKAITQLWKGKDSEALGRVTLPPGLDDEKESYFNHPVFVDACMQVIGAALDPENSQDTYLPIGIESFELSEKQLMSGWSYARLRPRPDDDVRVMADVWLFDESGRNVGAIKGVSLLLVDRRVFKRGSKPLDDWLYSLSWKVSNLENRAPESRHIEFKNCLLISDNRDLALSFSSQMKSYGHSFRTIIVEAGGSDSGEDHINITPSQIGELDDRLAALCSDGPDLDGVIHLFASIETRYSLRHESIEQAQKTACSSALTAARLLSGLANARRRQFWLITNRTQRVRPQDQVNVTHAPVWGLGRVIARELSSLRVCLLDVDTSDGSEIARIVLSELSVDEAEEQVAWRNGERYTARLERIIVNPESRLPSEPYCLKISQYGTFENLHFAPLTRRPPAAGEVELRVIATGLNFKDVLHALGMLNKDGAQSGIEFAADMPFGGECLGEVVTVGTNVSGIKVGERVIAAMAFGSFGSFVTVDSRFVAPVPAHVSDEAAATISTAFLTADYALHTLAKIRRGERVLIHAGAGGVGLAAIQVAKAAGARIYTTASPSKWGFLQALGVERVMNSRNLNFAEELSRPPCDGVDVVLNCLSGEFIAKSIQVLRPGGRFVEIGKIGVLSQNEVRKLRPDISYSSFDLMEIAESKPGLISSMLRSILDQIERRTLDPLPFTSFPMRRVADAFRYMSQARHIGKIIVVQERADRAGSQPAALTQLFKDKTCLITGGLGAIGLEIARWIVRQGGKNLVLVTRGEPGETAVRTIKALEDQGARILSLRADVSRREQLERIIQIAGESMPPIKGIFHAAGVLDDGIVTAQNWERFARVFAPKVAGAWNLHTAFKNSQLDYFVCFSSVAALIGSPGQANYAAANSFMDALAAHRSSLGLPGLSINWGPWSGSGMTGNLAERNRNRLRTSGVSLIESEEGLEVLESLLQQGVANAVAFPVNWSQFLMQFPEDNIPALYTNFGSDTASGGGDQESGPRQLLGLLRASNPERRLAVLCDTLREIIGTVLQIKALDTIPLNRTLRELGLDSLAGVEIKVKIEKAIGASLPSSLLLQAPSVVEIANTILEGLSLESPAETQSGSQSQFLSSWFTSNKQIPDHRARLFCFHHLGGGSSIFSQWHHRLPDWLEVFRIQLPGREDRIKEECIRQFDQLTTELSRIIYPLLDGPFFFYGHSMGALMAYDLAVTISEQYNLRPEHLFVGGLWPPQKHASSRQPIRSGAELLADLEIPDIILNDATYMETLIPIIRADDELLRSYRWKDKSPDFPITSFGGQSDPLIDKADISEWRHSTRGPSESHLLPGKHMFLVDSQSRLLEIISGVISRAMTQDHVSKAR